MALILLRPHAKADKTTGNETQTASTSSSKKSNKTLKRKAEHCYQYDSSESEDEEKCCVCNKFTPQAVRDCVSIVFTKWAQCDDCNRWVHLKYCTPVKVLRRGDVFHCPECMKRPEKWTNLL